MIVDTSAVISILLEEPDAHEIANALADNWPRRISAANYLEAAMVIDGAHDPIVSRRFDDFVKQADFLIEPVTVEQVILARSAFRDFGKGSGHPARLNFGDCFAYALAAHKDEALLFKGNDFGHTDIKSALAKS